MTIADMPAPLVTSAQPRRFTLGMATHLKDLEINREWLVSGNRDLEIGDVADPSVLLNTDELNVRIERINQLLEGHTGRRGIHGPFMGITIATPDPELRQVTARRFKQAIEFTSAIGGTHMVVHSPFMGWNNGFTFGGDPAEVERTIDWIQATLDPVIVAAEDAGVVLVIENIRDFNCFPLLKTVQTINSPAVRLSLDVGHCQLHVPAGGMPPDQYILETGPWLDHLHIQDNDSLSDRHWAPGRGSINFFAIFDALRRVDTNPRMILELKDKHLIAEASTHLADGGFAL